MSDKFFIDIDCRQIFCAGERIGGDSFVWKRFDGGHRTVAVLSDGMGHGVKANILSTLTSAIVLNFSAAKQDIASIARTILHTLPVCSVRKTSYSTFTIVDMNNLTGHVDILEYDNPRTMIFRREEPMVLEWESVETESDVRRQVIYRSGFMAADGDRLVMVSDGVSQSGQRTGSYKFGWGVDNVSQFASYLLMCNRNMTPHDLAHQLLSKASHNDASQPADDMSCAVLHIRRPRATMLVSCPPASGGDHKTVSDRLERFDGTKIICGYPVAEIIAGVRNETIIRGGPADDPLMPPTWKIPGVDMVTEGIITLSRLSAVLESGDRTERTDSTVGQLYRCLLRSDRIDFLIGTKRDVDTGLHVADEFELRRNILRRIAFLLESKYKKQVTVDYI